MAVYLSTNVLFEEWRSKRNPSLLKVGNTVGIRSRRWRLTLREIQVCYLDRNERVFHWNQWWAIYPLYELVWLLKVGESRAPLGGVHGPLVWIDSQATVPELVLQEIGG